MRGRMIAITAAVAIGSLATAANAVTFVGVRDGNAPYPDSLTVDGFVTPALFKCDVSGSSCVDDNDEPSLTYADNFTVNLSDTNGDGELIGGTFSFDDLGQDVLYPRFFALKAGNEFALFEIEASDFLGTSLMDIAFSTANPDLLGFDLFGKGLSNLSFYDTAAPIPLPAAGWLLISALAGLGYIGRRKLQTA